MITFITNNLVVILTLLFSLVSLIISILSWSKSRAVFGIETEVLRQPSGKKEDITVNTKPISDKLKSGEYTVLSIVERTKTDGDWEIILGRIKPY